MFSAAGIRIKNDCDTSEDYDKVYNALLMDPDNVAVQRHLEVLEAEPAAMTDYRTCSDFGDTQSAYLKTLDIVDHWGPSPKFYNV